MAIAAPARRAVQARSARVPTATLALYALILVGGVLTALPFYFMFVFATHSKDDIFSSPPPLWFGSSLVSNYEALMRATDGLFWRYFWNSFYLSSVQTLATLFFSSLGGFAFAVYSFRWREPLFAVVVGTMAIPGALNLIPFYLIMSRLGWVGEPRALWVPGIVGAFGIFWMRQYIASAIPRELVDAARVDGATEFGIFRRIIMPLSRPALATLGLINFIGIWNEFVVSSVLLQKGSSRTLQTALRAISGGTTATNVDWGGVMMGSAITVLPLLILFIFTSRQLIDGLTAGSVKT